jgi:hypothetical protein
MPSVADIQNVAAFRLVLDGTDLGEGERDISGDVAPRLLSLSLTEKRGGEADELELRIHDHDGRMDLPPEGAQLKLSLGWKKGADVPAGLVDKGSFNVDEVGYSGPPRVITIRARSAAFASGYRVRKERSHRDTTLGALVRRIAAENGLTAHVSARFAAIPVPVLAQDQKSDMALVRELGRRYDAVATVKARKLIFAPIGAGVTAGGRTLGAVAIALGDGDSFTYSRAERGQYDGVEARWHDRKAAARKTVKVDSRAGEAAAPSRGRRGARQVKRLGKVYHSEKAAREAADGEGKRMKRAAAGLDFTLALGRPDYSPERPARVSGFKGEIDGKSWLIAEATHSLDGSGGLTTKLKLESA